MQPATASTQETQPRSGHEKVLVLVKAIPHAGQRQGETVCCAGVTERGEWRRQYPVHFRRLREGFRRWDWINYDWMSPGRSDTRKESRRVQEDTIAVTGALARTRRAAFLAPLLMPSMDAAAALDRTLTLIRPRRTRFRHKAKTAAQLEAERRKYRTAAAQLSMLDTELAALEPCPYAFKFEFDTEDGVRHEMTCEDWETAAMFANWSRTMGTTKALDEMGVVFNEKYPAAGMAFAMGTHSHHPDQWLLIGVLRMNEVAQASLAL